MSSVPRHRISSPLYAVSLIPVEGSSRLRVSALTPYIWWNVLIGRVFPDAPESIFSRSVYPVPLSPGGWTSSTTNASSRVVELLSIVSRHCVLKVMA